MAEMRSAASKKVLRVGLTDPVDFQHPWKQVDFVNILVYWQIFETVFSCRPKRGIVTPELFLEPFKTEPASGSNNVYSAEVRGDVKFSDGTPMTVDHLVESLRQNQFLTNLAKIDSKGNRVYFTTDYTASNLALRLSNIELCVVLNRGSDFIGTGAYMRAPGSTPEFTRLLRNPHFRKKVNIEEIDLRVYPRDREGNAANLIAAVNSGEVDFTTCLMRHEADRIDSACKSFEQGAAACLLYFNTERKPLNNSLVRRALCHAIDRSALARLFYTNHLAYAASGLLPPSMDNIPDSFSYNPQLAAELLERSGIIPSARKIVLSTICGERPYLPDATKAADLIAEQIGAVGFSIEVRPTENLDDYFERTSRGDYDLMLSGWIPDTPSASDFLDVVLSSKNIPGGSLTVMTSVNLARWRSPRMDKLIASYRLDAKGNREAISKLLHEEAPVLAIMYGPEVLVHSWQVQNVPRGFSDLPLFAELKLA